MADDTTDTLNKAIDSSKKTTVTLPKTDPDQVKKAQESAEYLKSEAFIKRFNEEKKKLSAAFEPKTDTPLTKAVLSGTERLYIFISSSVPKETLRSFIKDVNDLKEPNIILVLRGFVGGMKKVRPTLNFISDLLKKDPSCEGPAGPCPYYLANIDIDPLAYRYFNITRVPAIAYAENVSMVNSEQSIGTPQNLKSKPRSNVYYGDMPLSYTLAKLSREFKNLKPLSTKLEKRGFYDGN
jgi:type-F conjugative transfer system pilin assembly protein TrbC